MGLGRRERHLDALSADRGSVTYFADLGSKEISGGNVSVAKLFNQLGTLSSFSGGGSSEHEGDFGVAEYFLNVGHLNLYVLFAHLACSSVFLITMSSNNNSNTTHDL